MSAVVARPSPHLREFSWPVIAGVLGLHGLLGVAIHNYPQLANWHALAAVGIGLWFAFQKDRPDRVAYAGCYLAGSEVLWRMVHFSLFWELAKFSIAAIFLASFSLRKRRKVPEAALLYGLVLLPSCLLTVTGLRIEEAREALTFNLSGPLALFASVLFFFGLRFTAGQMRRMFLAGLAPIVSVFTIAATSTLSASSLAFGRSSTKLTSGGYGPNQVSAVLGLGVLFCFLMLVIGAKGWIERIIWGAVLLALGVQSALTFSRGGLYAAVAASGFATLFLLRDARTRRTLIILGPVLAAVVMAVVLPRLEMFTGGALGERFENTGLTHRDDLARADFDIFLEHPILGIGPGMGDSERLGYHAHTEFSRLMSEHGLFGLAALAALIYMSFDHLRRNPTPLARAVVGAALVWSVLTMATNAMRLAAPELLFGVSATLVASPAAFPSIRRRRREVLGTPVPVRNSFA